MKITKRRIINVEQFTRLYAQNERLYIVTNLKDINPGIIKSVGFPEDLKVGTTILPKAKGPVQNIMLMENSLVIRICLRKQFIILYCTEIGTVIMV